jgi:DNA-binding PadR family transcriptional regulator
MKKQLLILALLRSQEMHGYQLNEMLAQSPGIPVTLKKANAYKLLGQMEAEGWITHREAYEGNRPPRRIYALTPAGEQAFQDLLRTSLADLPAPELPAAVTYSLLSQLPPAEAVALLRRRRQKAEDHWRALREVPAGVRRQHLGIEYMFRFYQRELEWIDELIATLAGE